MGRDFIHMEENNNIGNNSSGNKNKENKNKENNSGGKNCNNEGVLSRILLRIAGIILAAVALVYIGSVLLEDRKGEEEYVDLRKQVMEKEENDSAQEQQNSEWGEDSGSSLTSNEQEICRQVGRLQEENSHVTGWIDFASMKMGYPVMQGEDNETYLYHTYSGEYNRAGSIFMEASNSSDFQDSHTIIYGHNMHNGSMFGKLKQYRDKDFYKDHPYFVIYTRDKVIVYEIFAYYDIAEDGDIYDISFTDDAEFEGLINGMIKRRYYDTKVDVDVQDKLVTLSTCSKEGERFVVHGKQVENREAMTE